MPALIGSFYFFYFAVIAIHIIFMPKVLAMLGYSPSQIGIIFASAPLVRFALPFLFIRGLKLNRAAFNTALVVMVTAAAAIFVTVYDFWALLLTSIALGIGLSLILPYVEVIALSTIGKERYGKIRLFGSVGFILVALILVRYLNAPEVALAYLFAMVATTAVFGYYIAKHDHAPHPTGDDAPPASAISLLSHWPLWAGLMLMQVSFGAFYNFFTIYETDHGISLGTTVYLWTFGVIVEIIMLYFQGPLLRLNLVAILQFTTAATALRWLLVALFPENLPILYFSQAIHALSFALFHSAAISYLFSFYRQKQLAQQFFAGISYGLGGFIGAVGAGYIYEYLPTQLFYWAAGVAFLSFVALRYSSKHPHQ